MAWTQVFIRGKSRNMAARQDNNRTFQTGIIRTFFIFGDFNRIYWKNFGVFNRHVISVGIR